MIDFKKLPAPALSYAVIGTNPERVEPDAATQIWKLQRKNRQLEHENRMLWVLSGTMAVCFTLVTWAPVIFGGR